MINKGFKKYFQVFLVLPSGQMILTNLTDGELTIQDQEMTTDSNGQTSKKVFLDDISP